METGGHDSGREGMLLGGVVRKLDAYSGGVRDDEVAVLLGDGGLDYLGLRRFMLSGGVLLEGEVGDAGGYLETRRCADRAERVVRHDADVVGLGERGYLLGVGDAAHHADVRSDVLDGAAPEQHLELVDGVETLAGGDGDVDVLGDQFHGVEVFGEYGVFVEEGVESLDAPRERYCLGGREAAVNFDAQVNVVAHGVAVHPDRLDCVLYLVRVGLEVGDVPLLVQEGREVSDGGEAHLFGVFYALNQRLAGVAEDVVIDARLVPRLAAEQLVRGDSEVLSGDVPHGDVEGAERAHDGRAPEVGVEVHILPVVFDAEGVFADQVSREQLDGGLRRLEVAPGS